MEKYIDKSSIVSLEMHYRELLREYNRVYVPPTKLFFGLLTIKKGYYTYQNSDEYIPHRRSNVSLKNLFNAEFNGNKYYELVENKVYQKPHCIMFDKNGRKYITIFNTDKELDEYIESLDLDIVKKYVKIKID